MQLRHWQTEFQALVVAAETDTTLRECESITLLQQGAEREVRLAIYQNAYHQRLCEALRSNFPAVHQLLGDVDFAAAAQQFLLKHPPSTASIRWFGEGFPNWLFEEPPYSGCPATSELAQFEWALRHAIDAADADRMKTDHMQAIAPEQWSEIYFQLHPSVTLLNFQWNTISIWQALNNNATPPQPKKSPSQWIVSRQDDLMNAWRSVEALEIEALTRLTGGQSFGDLCEHIFEQLKDSQQAINQSVVWLKTWIEQGLLTESDLTEKTTGAYA